MEQADFQLALHGPASVYTPPFVVGRLGRPARPRMPVQLPVSVLRSDRGTDAVAVKALQSKNHGTG